MIKFGNNSARKIGTIQSSANYCVGVHVNIYVCTCCFGYNGLLQWWHNDIKKIFALLTFVVILILNYLHSKRSNCWTWRYCDVIVIQNHKRRQTLINKIMNKNSKFTGSLWGEHTGNRWILLAQINVMTSPCKFWWTINFYQQNFYHARWWEGDVKMIPTG